MPFADSPQLPFINIVVDIPFVPQTQILMVQTIQQTTEFPQLQYFSGACVGRAVFAMCVFTAPVAEPTVMSFTVPWIGWTIAATANVVTSCSSSADCGGICVAMSCVCGFSPGGAYDSVWDSVKPMAGKYLFNYFQYQGFVGCICMLNYRFSSYDEICPDYYNYSFLC